MKFPSHEEGMCISTYAGVSIVDTLLFNSNFISTVVISFRALVFLFEKNHTLMWKRASKEKKNPQRQETYYDPLLMTGRNMLLDY